MEQSYSTCIEKFINILLNFFKESKTQTLIVIIIIWIEVQTNIEMHIIYVCSMQPRFHFISCYNPICMRCFSFHWIHSTYGKVWRFLSQNFPRKFSLPIRSRFSNHHIFTLADTCIQRNEDSNNNGSIRIYNSGCWFSEFCAHYDRVAICWHRFKCKIRLWECSGSLVLSRSFLLRYYLYSLGTAKRYRRSCLCCVILMQCINHVISWTALLIRFELWIAWT